MSIYDGSYRANGDPKISLNFFELILSAQSIDLAVGRYIDRDNLKSLRELNPDYFFYRDGEEVFVWQTREDTSTINFPDNSIQTISFLYKPRLFAKIIQVSVDSFLKSIGLKFVGKKLFIPEFVNLENNLCPNISGLALYSKVSIETEIMNFAGQPKLGFLINYSFHTEFTDAVSKLMERGVDPRGMLIKKATGEISKVVQVDKDVLILDDKTSINASDVVPLADRKNQLQYLSSIGKTEEFSNVLDMENKPNKIYSKIHKTYEFIKKNKDKLFLGGIFDIKDILNFAISSNSNGLKKDILFRPTHFYRDNQPQKAKYPSDALSEQGPFIDPQKELKILVLSPVEHKGNVELFLKKLTGTLKSLFHFENIVIKDLYFSKAESVLKGYENLLYSSDLKTSDYDVALIIISEEYRYLPTEQNPYYVIKSLLMGDRVPSQEVEIETIKQMRGIESYVLNNIALAIYGKIGGTPWAIERLDPLRKEFIIGIGSSILKDGNDAARKIIGLATVFDFTGRYIVGECSTLATADNYREVLKDSLITLISGLIERENIQPENEVRLIFHLFKPAGKHNEFWAIEKALENFKKYSIEYAVLHLNEGHNFRIFANDGVELPQRGLLVETSDNKKLLSFVSSSLHRNIRGNPAPLLVVLDTRSTFKDIDYLIKQVFYFSFLSCRSFIPSKTPITILYPSLLAFLSGKLKEIPGWDYRKLATVKDKLWFI